MLVLLLRPWSFRDSVGRVVLATALFVPWTAFSIILSMHTGPIGGARLFWLLLVCVALVCGLVAVSYARRKQPRLPAKRAADIEKRSA